MYINVFKITISDQVDDHYNLGRRMLLCGMPQSMARVMLQLNMLNELAGIFLTRPSQLNTTSQVGEVNLFIC